jgi:YhcH/YjgK/YiaL family protein
MVIDTLERALALHRGMGPRMAAALEALTDPGLLAKTDGRYELDGDRLVAIVQTYQTKPREQGAWEAHRRYIDVQFVAAGSELMGYAPLASLIAREPYDVAKDVAFYDGAGAGFLRVDAGMVAIFHPHDAHMPSLMLDAPQWVRKIVLKVRVD